MKPQAVKILVPLIIIAAVAISMGIYVPYYVKHVHKQFKVGQSVGEVSAIITGLVKHPDNCTWEWSQIDEPLPMISDQCSFPEDKIFVEGKGNKFELKISFVGPGFSKNDFQIVFSNAGKVLTISEIRRWD